MPRDDIRSGSSVLPPFSGIVELVVLTGLIVAVDMMLPDVDLSDIQPNPFWLPVLLLSLQYGTVSGMLAAATALLVMLMSGLPEPGVGENYFSYAMRVFAQPILWFGAAVLLGQFRMRQIEAKRGLTAMVVDLEKQRAALARYASALRARCDMLERDRAGRSEVASVSLLASLADMGSADTGADGLGRGFARAMAAAFPGARASVLVVSPTGLVPLLTTSAHLDGPPTPVVDDTHPLYRTVVGGNRALSVLHAGDEHHLAGSGIAATPIHDAAGAVIGVLRLDSADPLSLGPGTLPALSVIAAAVAPRLASHAASLGLAVSTIDQGGMGYRDTGHGDGTVGGGGHAAPGSVRRKLRVMSWSRQRSEAAPVTKGTSESAPPHRIEAPS